MTSYVFFEPCNKTSGIVAWTSNTTLLPSLLDHGVHKNNKYNNFNWIPWSSHGMTLEKLFHQITL
ncbi:MAG TPA: hypothetical protein LFV92_02485 [Rickettsia endosymbiont of Ceroptres masudai]|nr:hypothetical protein [Rickettsia endosymbiont of Ceroptres masudai]